MSERVLRAEAEWPFSTPVHGVPPDRGRGATWAGARDGPGAESRARGLAGRLAPAVGIGAWALVVVLLAALSANAAPPSYAPIDRLLADPDGRVTGVAYVRGEVVIRAAPGIDASRSGEMACGFVRPILRDTPLQNAPFRVLTDANVEIASDRTPCR